VLYRAIGNILHHLPAPERSHLMLSRLRTRIEPPKPRPRPVGSGGWSVVSEDQDLIPVELQPFIDICQAHTLWHRHVGHWSRTTFDVRRLAVLLGRKPWYRPFVPTMRD
jgi:hypothetical protein